MAVENLVKSLSMSVLDQVVDSLGEINVANMSHLPYAV
jgi:hypothetical protein